MEFSLHECPSIDNWIPYVCKHDGHSVVLAAVADQLEDQRDRLIPSEIAGDRIMGKSEGHPWLCCK